MDQRRKAVLSAETCRVLMIEVLIRKLERYAPLTGEQREAIGRLPVKLRQFERGATVIQQGARPDESLVLLEGFVFRYKLLTAGTRQIVSLQIPGDFVDLHSLVLRPLDHAVAAASTIQIARVPHEAIRTLLADHPRLAESLMWNIAIDGAISREWLANHGRRSAYEQLAHLFCELYFRMEWAGLVKDRSFEMPLTQIELSDLCGLSAVHLNRSLQALRRDGLILLENQRLTVLDIDELVRRADFDPAYLHLLG